MFRKSLCFSIALAAFFLYAKFIFAEEALLRLSLEDCLRVASQNNASLSAKEYAVEGSKWRYQETRVRFWPIIEYNDRMAPAPKDADNAAESFFGGDVTFLNTAKIGVGIPLYAFGQIDRAQALAQKGIEASEEEKKKEETKISFEIKQLYYGILLSRDLIDVAQDALNKINNQLKTEEETHKHSPYEILKLKIFKADLERRLAEAKTKAKIAKEALRIQLGLPMEQPFELSGNHLETSKNKLDSMEHYLSLAMEMRPDVDLVDIGFESKRLEYQLENRKVFPKIGFGGFFEIGRTASSIRNVSAKDDFTDPFNFTRAGVGVEIKGVFDIHGHLSRVKRLENEYHKATMERSVAKQRIELDIKDTYEEAKRAEENVVRADEKVKMGRQMMFLSKTNLDIGVGEEQQYTDALQLVLLARGEYLKSLYDYNVALARLDQKIGKRLTDEQTN